MAHAAFLASPACPALGPSRLTAPRHRRVPSKSSRLITRAKAADDVEDEDAKAFMGRRGTRREDVEDDADTAEARSSVKQQGGFGKPVTAKETWQPFQRTARAGLLEAADGERTGSPDHRDLVRTSLYISMEDDAFKSRTAVCLPIAAYVKRVDKLMDEFTAREIPALVAANGGTPLTTARDHRSTRDTSLRHQQIRPAQRMARGESLFLFIFVRAIGLTSCFVRSQMYSPYRTYFHNVVAQKIGIPATLAALYIGCVDRLHAKGVIPEGESIDVLIRPKARSGIAGVTAPVAPWVSFFIFFILRVFNSRIAYVQCD
jgi:hypothetical protein